MTHEVATDCDSLASAYVEASRDYGGAHAMHLERPDDHAAHGRFLGAWDARDRAKDALLAGIHGLEDLDYLNATRARVHAFRAALEAEAAAFRDALSSCRETD